MFISTRALAAVALATGSAIALAGCAGSPEPADTYDPDEKVSLDLAFWGNDVRADLYNKAIDAFNESMFVRSAITLIVLTIPPISSERFPISRITPADCSIAERTRSNP